MSTIPLLIVVFRNMLMCFELVLEVFVSEDIV